MTDDELAAAAPEKSRLIEITDFVDLEKIDPVFFRTTYYLAPEGDGAEKAYVLLRQVMRNTNKVAIGTLVMRNKEYPVAIRPDDEVLKLETMYFADEIRSPKKDLPDLPSSVELNEREIAMAQVLLESMESNWDPDTYHDTHREKVETLIEEKRQGRDGAWHCASSRGHEGCRSHGSAQRQHRLRQGQSGCFEATNPAEEAGNQTTGLRKVGKACDSNWESGEISPEEGAGSSEGFLTLSQGFEGNAGPVGLQRTAAPVSRSNQ